MFNRNFFEGTENKYNLFFIFILFSYLTTFTKKIKYKLSIFKNLEIQIFLIIFI